MSEKIYVPYLARVFFFKDALCTFCQQVEVWVIFTR